MANPACGHATPSPLSVPTPRSPPKYPDICGRHRKQAQLHALNREIGFLEEELHSLETRQPASKCFKEVVDFVGTNPDPFIPIAQKVHRSSCLWKWLCCSKSCCNASWICNCGACSICQERPRCKCGSVGKCNCCLPRCCCRCCYCSEESACSSCCYIPSCSNCCSCSCDWSCCTCKTVTHCYPTCTNKSCCTSCYLCP